MSILRDRWGRRGLLAPLLAPHTLTALCVVALGAASASPSARAQANAVSPPEMRANPTGDYVQTCTHASVTDTVLKAVCQTGTGGVMWSSLGLSACAPGAPVFNLGGQLSCIARSGTWGDGGAIPPGQYLQSCTQVLSSATELQAQCASAAGARFVVLNLQRCEIGSDIVNKNGVLVCIRPIARLR